MNRVLRELRHLILRRHLREIHFSYASINGRDRRALLSDALGMLLGTRVSDGETVARLEAALASMLNAKQVVAFRSGRTALRAILAAMGIGAGDEVIVPGFTCVVVSFAVQHCGARPVFIDIGPDYRMDLHALRCALTPTVKAIIAQHNFGMSERIMDIVAVARARGIRVIEDCAHVSPGSGQNGHPLGTWGDAAFFSFEVTKPISCGWGGAAVTSDETLGRLLIKIREEAPIPGRITNLKIGLQLLVATLLYHPNLFAIGRWILAGLYRLGILPISVPMGERQGDPPSPPIGRLADIQAMLLLRQISRLSGIIERRRRGTETLAERLGGVGLGLSLLRYPVRVTNREEMVECFRRHQIELGQWFQAPLHPPDCDFGRAQYRWGSCPMAEEISRTCVNLPTLLEGADLERVIDVTTRYLSRAPRGNDEGRSAGSL